MPCSNMSNDNSHQRKHQAKQVAQSERKEEGKATRIDARSTRTGKAPAWSESETCQRSKKKKRKEDAESHSRTASMRSIAIAIAIAIAIIFLLFFGRESIPNALSTLRAMQLCGSISSATFVILVSRRERQVRESLAIERLLWWQSLTRSPKISF